MIKRYGGTTVHNILIKSFCRIVGNVKHSHEGHTGSIKVDIKISTKIKQYL